jgi:uncharacterized protein YneR
MAKLEAFADLCKPQDDLWKKNFYLEKSLGLAVYSRSGPLSFKSGFSQGFVGSVPESLATATFQYKTADYLLKEQFFNSGLVKLRGEVIPPKNPDFKLKAEFELSAKALKPTFTVEHSSTQDRTKLALVGLNEIKASAVVGNSSAGLGVDVAVDVNEAKAVDYSAALWLVKPNWRAVVKQVRTRKMKCPFGDCFLSSFWRKSDDFQLGVVSGWKGGEIAAEVAASKTLANGAVVKGRVNFNGILGLALRTKVKEGITVVAAAQLDVTQIDSPFKYGVRFKINQ